MMFKTAISMLAAAALFSASALAANNVPDQCPSANAIKSVGFYDVDMFEEGMWFGYNTDTYGTDFTWMFVFGFIDANSADEARHDGSKWLPMLSGNPEPANMGGVWGCEYDLPGGMAVAVIDDGYNALHHLMSFSRK